MKNLIVRTMLVIASIAVTAVLFQNCSENFNISKDMESGSANLGSNANHTAPTSIQFPPNLNPIRILNSLSTPNLFCHPPALSGLTA